MGSYASKNTIGWLINAIKDRFVKKEDFDDLAESQDAFYSEEFVPLTEQVSNIGHGIYTEGDGVNYLADVPGIDSLEVGSWFIMIPNVESSVDTPTLNVNNLGAKNLRCKTSGFLAPTQPINLFKDIPVLVIYAGHNWIVNHTIPDADSLLGVVSIEQGGTGAETAEVACENLGAFPVTGGTVTGATTFESTVTIGNATLEYDSNEEALVVTFA